MTHKITKVFFNWLINISLYGLFRFYIVNTAIPFIQEIDQYSRFTMDQYYFFDIQSMSMIAVGKLGVFGMTHT